FGRLCIVKFSVRREWNPFEAWRGGRASSKEAVDVGACPATFSAGDGAPACPDGSFSALAVVAAPPCLRLAVLCRAELGTVLPHRRIARPRRRGDAAQRRLGRADAVWPTAADQAARHVCSNRSGELAVRGSARVDGPAALGDCRNDPGAALRAGVRPHPGTWCRA